MVIDLFYFNGEHDVAEIRFNILNDYVDEFIVVEALKTFSGVPKELLFDKDKYPQFAHKIRHFIVEEGDKNIEKTALLSPNTGNGEPYWLEEFYQKEYAIHALTDCKDDDIVFISDVDEIWNPNIKFDYTDKAVYKPKQLPYLYYVNQKTDEDWLGWTGTVFTRYENIKNACINHLRTDSMNDYVVVENGGWHFNSMNGKDIKKDLFKHPLYEQESEWRRREINMRVDESDLPEYLINNKEKWKKLFLV